MQVEMHVASTADHYASVMGDAKEAVFLVAARRAIDTRLLAVEFDAGRGPGPHETHILTISVRDAPIAVSSEHIPHEWLSVSTSFIDTRFSRLVGGLLAELVRIAASAGRLL